MDFLTFSNKKDIKNFKALLIVVSLSIIFVVYEIFEYIKYLIQEKFLIDFNIWNDIDCVSNIVYLFSNFFGILGIGIFAYAIYKLIHGKCNTLYLISSFIFQLISCTILVIDNVLINTIPTYLTDTTKFEKSYLLFTSILLFIVFIILILYIFKVVNKNVAITFTSIMLVINSLKLIDLFTINFKVAIDFFFFLSLSTRLIYLIVAISILFVILSTVIKEKEEKKKA